MKVYNLIVLDESGSMGSIYRQALTGVNETIQTIQNAQQDDPAHEQVVTLISFETRGRDEEGRICKSIFNYLPVGSVREITERDYKPYGGTPLYDALGESLTELEKHLAADDHALVTIITDGMENASSKYTAQSVREIIERMTQKKVVFTYIGANQDVMLEAGRIGIRNSMAFESTQAGTRVMFQRQCESRKAYYERVKNNECEVNGAFFDGFDPQKADPQGNGPQHGGQNPPHGAPGNYGPNDVFVFGSNAQGVHNGGAAREALLRYGAVMGVAEGLQGNSYGIVTVGCSYDDLRAGIARFITFAKQHPELRFHVTSIGCGHAGYRVEDVAPLFREAMKLPNVILPKEFVDYNRRHGRKPSIFGRFFSK